MVSHQCKAIFIHQRKAAGSAIITSVGIRPDEANWRLFSDGTCSAGWRRKEVLAKDCVVFTVVRNPWDRFISGWKYLSAYQHRPLTDVLSDLLRTGHDYKHLTRPQTDILFDEDGRLVPAYVLRFEDRQEDYRRLCARLGKPSCALPVLNRTEHEPYQHNYDRSTIEWVSDLCWRDIEIFGYEFATGTMNPRSPEMRGKLLDQP